MGGAELQRAMTQTRLITVTQYGSIVVTHGSLSSLPATPRLRAWAPPRCSACASGWTACRTATTPSWQQGMDLPSSAGYCVAMISRMTLYTDELCGSLEAVMART